MNAVVRGHFVSLPPRTHRRRLPRCEARSEGSGGFVDYYDLLEVDSDATIGEIKFNFRRLQKQYHPDVSGAEEVSSTLNQAYQTLIDPNLRQRYDRRIASVPLSQREWKRSFKDQPGIVGPISDAEIVMQEIISVGQHTETEVEEKTTEHVIWLREWAKTFIFAADLPLPLPLQCDEIDNGVRLAFITTAKNRIRSAGELYLVVEIEEDETTHAHVQYLSVYRVVSSSFYGPIPGEHQVMKAFRNALRDKSESTHGKSRFFGFELSGFAASAAAQFMPALVTLPLEKISGSSYEAYHLKHPTSQ